MNKTAELTFGTTPNFLTLLRIVLVPVVIGLLYLGTPAGDLAAALVFTAASITDFFDGYIARKQQSVTIYGKLLDPLADKFLVVCSLIMLQALGRVHPVLVMLLICRELAITGLRALASAEGVIIAASSSAKWKTAIQMFGVPFLMLKSDWPFGISLFSVGTVLVYTSLAISLWSAKDYIVEFFRAITRKHEQGMRALREKREAKQKTRIAKKLARKLQKLSMNAESADVLVRSASPHSNDPKDPSDSA